MLEKLFTSKARIKILGHLLFAKNESYIREISKDLKISTNSVKIEIDNLISIGLIKRERNLVKVNGKSSIIGEIKSIFVKTDYVIYPIREILEKEKKIKFAFVFGSIAKGDFDEESDIDLMVIGDIDSFSLTNKLRNLEKEIGKEINPVVWKMKTLKEKMKTGFFRDILKKGFIMAKGEENEFRKIVG